MVEEPVAATRINKIWNVNEVQILFFDVLDLRTFYKLKRSWKGDSLYSFPIRTQKTWSGWLQSLQILLTELQVELSSFAVDIF